MTVGAPRRPRAVAPATLVLGLLPLLASVVGGCSRAGETDRDELTVLAASSLTEVLEQLATRFERDHAGVEVRLSFGSSTTLADQAAQGAPGDVLATADEASMALADEAGALAADPIPFAANELVLVVPADNPAEVDGVEDLAGTDWVRCADDVPCGRVALALVEANRVTAEPASLEVDVKSVLAKVTAGEADAGLVYRTDARAAGPDVRVVEVPHAEDHLAHYVAAPLTQAGDDSLAAAFVELLASPVGRDALVAAGFRPPEGG